MSEFDPNGSPDTSIDSSPAPAIQGTPAEAVPATPATAPQTPATGVPEGYVPSYRVRETRESVMRQAQAERAQLEAGYHKQLETLQRQVRALAGFEPDQNQESDQIRAEFTKLFPKIAKLEEMADELEQLRGQVPNFERQIQHHWSSYAQQTMDRLFSKASEAYGGTLSPEAKRGLHSSFVGWIQSSPENYERYERDPTVVDDFWKAFSSSFIDPVRRSANAGVGPRVNTPLPQDTPSGAPRSSQPQTFKSLEDRVGAAWNSYNSLSNK